MEIFKADWSAYRGRLLPLIVKAEVKNGHKFADQTDQALLEQRAFLFLSPEGFCVLRPITVDGLTHIEVMFAHSWHSHAIIKHQKTIEYLTRDIGGRSVILYTALQVLIPLLKRLGYKHESSNGCVAKLSKEL